MKLHCRLAPLLLLTALLGGCDSSGGMGSPTDFISSAFSDFIPPDPGVVARDAFNISDADKRRRAVNLLSNAPYGGEDAYLRTYRLLVDDPDPTVRAACLRALGKHGDPSDTAAILPNLNAKAGFVRWEAASALQRLHHENAIDPLIVAMREDLEPKVRAAAANALGQYPEERVFQALVGSLSDENFSVITETVNALETLTGKRFGEDGAEWIDWADDNENLFAERRPYFYPQYIKPPGLLTKMQVWKEPKTVTPTQPRGTPESELVTKPVDDDLNNDLSGDPG